MKKEACRMKKTTAPLKAGLLIDEVPVAVAPRRQKGWRSPRLLPRLSKVPVPAKRRGVQWPFTAFSRQGHSSARPVRRPTRTRMLVTARSSTASVYNNKTGSFCVAAFGRKPLTRTLEKTRRSAEPPLRQRHHTVFGQKMPIKSPLRERPLGVCWRVILPGVFCRALANSTF